METKSTEEYTLSGNNLSQMMEALALGEWLLLTRTHSKSRLVVSMHILLDRYLWLMRENSGSNWIIRSKSQGFWFTMRTNVSLLGLIWREWHIIEIATWTYTSSSRNPAVYLERTQR